MTLTVLEDEDAAEEDVSEARLIFWLKKKEKKL
jgi:hypothetical protein